MSVNPYVIKVITLIAETAIREGLRRDQSETEQRAIVENVCNQHSKRSPDSAEVVESHAMPSEDVGEIRTAIVEVLNRYGLNAAEMIHKLEAGIGKHPWGVIINPMDQYRGGTAWCRIVTDKGDLIHVDRPYYQ